MNIVIVYKWIYIINVKRILSDVTFSGTMLPTNISYMKIIFSIDVYFVYTDVMRQENPPTHEVE